ncbi:uncharacterized protein LOC119723203 [Patiria miniata]|uniref:C-type lectin domain-containing protein n=1 Tax=Patiria miniata TaxID=46514 RepID=A0A913ZD31_PATMI|nr:uncharacterized protein LOC119723203 [Patiria miniata]
MVAMTASGGKWMISSKQLKLSVPMLHFILTLVALAWFLLAVHATTPANNGPCPDGWEVQGQKCFRFLKESKNWQDSRDYCIGIGGDLVVLESQAETDYLVEKMRAYDAHTFLGCRDVETDGHWVCEGYDPSTTYFDEGGSSSGHWTTENPFQTNGGTDENCMEIYHEHSWSVMNDVSCDTLDPLVSCQLKLEDTTTPITTLPQQPTTIVITTPQQLTTAPQQVTTAPQQMTTAPEQVTTAPGQVTTAPEQVTTAPEQVTTHQTAYSSVKTPNWLFSSPFGPGHCLGDRVVTQFTTRLTLQCALRCLRAQWCASFNTIKDGDQTKSMTCQLNDAGAGEMSSLQGTVGCITFNKLFNE